MSTSVVVLGGLSFYLAAYFSVGKWFERKVVRADPRRLTPAHRLRDGGDFVPTDRFVLFGHHFASIAGAAPIIGPVVAMLWGWLPGLLWVWLGNIFVGAVHDYLALMASVRHDGHSIQWVAARLIRPRTGLAFGWFVMFALILIVAAFAAIIGQMFVTTPSVASASLMLIVVALVQGFLMYRTRLPFWLTTLLGLVMLTGCIVAGLWLPVRLSYGHWLAFLLVYIVVAASIPVNVLLQPRDYLNAWLLVLGLALGGTALIVVWQPLVLPPWTGFSVPLSMGGGVSVAAAPFWPVIPLIVACGSLSGFHALVGSGTTSKQLDQEPSGLLVAYGGMFTEGFLATTVIAAVGAFAAVNVPPLQEALARGTEAFLASYSALLGEKGPVVIFSQAYSVAVNRAFGLPQAPVAVLASMWVASFALTTLDTTNRLARYTWTELMEPLSGRFPGVSRVLGHRWTAAGLPAMLGLGLAWSGSFAMIWPAFGGANQMLASVAMLTSAVWVSRELRAAAAWPVVVPALALWGTVSVALGWYLWVVIPAYGRHQPVQAWVLGGLVVLMLALNGLLLVDFVRRIRQRDEGPTTGEGRIS